MNNPGGVWYPICEWQCILNWFNLLIGTKRRTFTWWFSAIFSSLSLIKSICPNRTTTGGLLGCTQCIAVKTKRSLIKVPPQLKPTFKFESKYPKAAYRSNKSIGKQPMLSFIAEFELQSFEWVIPSTETRGLIPHRHHPKSELLPPVDLSRYRKLFWFRQCKTLSTLWIKLKCVLCFTFLCNILLKHASQSTVA